MLTLRHLWRAGSCALGLSLSLAAGAETLRVNQTDHPLDGFAVGALQVALKHMKGDFELKVTHDPVTQSRAIEWVKSGDMEVMWLATNQSAERDLLPIYFPLLKGLLGHRVMIIAPEKQAVFDRVQTLDDVRRLTFGQGIGWPDVEILRGAGLNVLTTGKYENLFPMAEGSRFDGFPRGVLEPWAELRARTQLDLTVERNIVLVYPLPFYLFVNRDRPDLAAKLQEALDAALAAGDYDKYYYNAQLIRDALDKSNLKNRKVFRLTNHELTKETPLERKDYWLDLEAL